MSFPEKLTFNDVLMVPQESNIRSRKKTDLSTNLTKKIRLKIPIVSSNMDTVTEEEMAIAMALSGGIGIIHRFLSTQDQVDIVKKVKRHINYRVDNPYTIIPHATIDDFKRLVNEKGVKSFPVVDEQSKLFGIVTHRDYIFSKDAKYVKEIMTSLENLTYSNEEISIDSAYDLMKKSKVEKLPLVNNERILTGLITIKDIIHYREANKVSTVDSKGRLMVGAAVGVKPEDIDRAEALINADVDVLVVDVAHGHNILAFETIQKLKSKFPDMEVIAGNVATAKGVRYLVEAGADCVKIGIGNGSICITRMVTGCGVPQLSALIECVEEAKKYNIPIISDGGNGGIIGNIVKALGTGASVVMLGNFLAGTDESPGQVLVKDNKRVKYVRGMSGYGANISRRQNIESRDDVSDVVPEGVDAYVPYKGSVKGVLTQICGGIRCALSYTGSNSLEELPHKAEFIKITDAGRKNSNYHNVNLL